MQLCVCVPLCVKCILFVFTEYGPLAGGRHSGVGKPVCARAVLIRCTARNPTISVHLSRVMCVCGCSEAHRARLLVSVADGNTY
jgi:hypothetical protein